MPHFFIDMDLGDTIARDEEGADYADLLAARKETLASLADLAKMKIDHGDHHDFVGKVRSGDGKLLFTATLSLTVASH